MTNLSHAASFNSNERIAPSNRGIKQLGIVCYLALLSVNWLLVPDAAKLDAVVRLMVGLRVGMAVTCC